MLEDTLKSADFPLLPSLGEPATVAASPFEDMDAVHALYESRVFRFLLLSTRDRDLAGTLTQDTFVKLWRTRASFRGDCSPATWITRIALSLLRTHTRGEAFRFWKRAAVTSIDAADLASRLPHSGRTAEQMLIARQSLEQVWKCVEELSPRQRTVFLLRFVEELELQDIAEAMDIPLPTVKSHLYRAIDRVRAAHEAHSTRKARL